MAPAQPPQLHITEPGEAAQIIPYLVGFVPEESLVISAIQNGRIQVTARVDLADVTPSGAVESLLDRIWSRFPDSDAHVTAYTAGDHEPAWKLLTRCDAWLPYGCAAMLIDHDTWHLPDGTTGHVETNGFITAGASYAGLQRLDRRADLEARFTGPPDTADLTRRADAAVAQLPPASHTAEILTRTGDLLHQHLPSRGPDRDPRDAPPVGIPDEAAMQLAALVHHPEARDLALLSIDHHTAAQHLDLWQQVIQAAPASGADMPLYLAGMAAWISGDGASANIALERALATSPAPGTPHPAQLLEGIIDQVLPPAAWDGVLRGLLISDTSPAVSQALNTPPPPNPATRAGWPPTPKATGRGRERAPRKPPSPGITI